jgi:GNAT superfamily N-acetyltransferase
MIRTADKKDIPEIIGLMKSEPGFWDELWRDNALEIGIDAANGLSFIFEDKGKIVGFACAHDFGFRAYLSELIISREYRNKGIGESLINRIENTLSEIGCKILISDVWKGALPFYRSIGWSEPDVLLMRKNLP